MYYLAYGSNLHPIRLQQRVPSSLLVGTTQLAGYRLAFRKRSNKDFSAKCDLQRTSDPNPIIYGAVYEIPNEETLLLDKIEGVGNGYEKAQVEVTSGDKSYSAFVYLATPSHVSSDLLPFDWYKQIVVAGARKLRFPAEYIDEISQTPSMPDPDETRRAKMEQLIAQLDF